MRCTPPDLRASSRAARGAGRMRSSAWRGSAVSARVCAAMASNCVMPLPKFTRFCAFCAAFAAFFASFAARFSRILASVASSRPASSFARSAARRASMDGSIDFAGPDAADACCDRVSSF